MWRCSIHGKWCPRKGWGTNDKIEICKNAILLTRPIAPLCVVHGLVGWASGGNRQADVFCRTSLRDSNLFMWHAHRKRDCPVDYWYGVSVPEVRR